MTTIWKPLAVRDRQLFDQLVNETYNHVAEHADNFQDIEDVLRATLEHVDARRLQARAEEMSRRIAEQQEAEQRQRDRLTERDPDVQAAIEELKRLNTQNLYLLRDNGTDEVRAAAIRMILAERAERAKRQVESAGNGVE